MAKIDRIELMMISIPPKSERVDAIQAFTMMEIPLIRIHADDGAVGTGYGYTIGTAGYAIHDLLARHLLPELIGRDPAMVDENWQYLYGHMRFMTVGPVSSGAMAAIDTALWDMRCRRAGLPLHVMAGGAQRSVPLYRTEGGWLQLPAETIVENAREAKASGLGGFKMKVGRRPAEDLDRMMLVREAVGDDFDLMVDANQAFRVEDAVRRAEIYRPANLTWFEEPLPADDIEGHARVVRSTSTPIAIGETLFSVTQAKEYLQRGACSVLQVDAGRIGGITPWLKAAHLADAFNVPVCPHFLMELHVGLTAAVPNGRWVEYIPQVEEIATMGLRVENGRAIPSPEPGLGIEWDWDAIRSKRDEGSVRDIRRKGN